ncbi:threonine aldolase [Mesorhizobium soli]|uniref:threonine aldolase family protein n=1 Tax=Pseudaminobacter soli (ex Li et al. 2025) TaxID=1295366 RepID=UPI002473F813|nr:low specificity L-threonine aldolase [Mesorhizobium soli]MDH6233497.1 threonine aldolase [Mesorhizobium soli]
MFFASDNWAGAHPKIAAGLSAHGTGFASAYGTSDIDRKVGERFNEIFEREVSVFFVGTGTAANSLSLAAYNQIGGVSFMHRDAHMLEDECGAPEFLTGGSRLRAVDGPLGRMTAENLERAIAHFEPEVVHSGVPMAVSVTQATEVGTIYSLADLDAISAIAKKRGLPLHMDGARFANALVALDTTPAEMTWKRGVDIVSFGGTKNGCWCAEAVVLFDTSKAREFSFLRKRAAQLFSKSRFIAAQFDAYLADGLWLENARHSNAMSAKLADAIAASSRIRLAWRPQANEVFAVMPKSAMKEFTDAGAVFYPWNTPRGYTDPIGADETMCRFVTSFATTAEEVDRFGALIA